MRHVRRLELASKTKSSVRNVEYVMRGNSSLGKVTSDYTQAVVTTPMGDVGVRKPGYYASPDRYPALIESAMNMAWHYFCNAEDPCARFDTPG